MVTAAPSMKQRQRALREDAIVAAARVAMVRDGYAAMTLEGILREVGISKPTLYTHFESKQALAVRVLLDAMREALAKLAELEAGLSPGDAARAMIDWSVDRQFGADPQIDLSGVAELFAHPALSAAEQAFARGFSRLIAAAQAAGAARADVNADLAARSLLSLLKDGANMRQAQRGRIDCAALQRDVAVLLLGA